MTLDEAIWTEARSMIDETRRLIVQQFGQIERVIDSHAIRFDPAPEALAYLEGGPVPRPSASKLALRVAAQGFDPAEVARRIEEVFADALRDGRDGEAAVGTLGFLAAIANPAGGRVWAFRLR